MNKGITGQGALQDVINLDRLYVDTYHGKSNMAIRLLRSLNEEILNF